MILLTLLIPHGCCSLQLDPEESYRKFEETWMEITHTRFLRHPNILRCVLCLSRCLSWTEQRFIIVSVALPGTSLRSSRGRSFGSSCL